MTVIHKTIHIVVVAQREIGFSLIRQIVN